MLSNLRKNFSWWETAAWIAAFVACDELFSLAGLSRSPGFARSGVWILCVYGIFRAIIEIGRVAYAVAPLFQKPSSTSPSER
jgi:hypothetical protein